MNNRPEFVKQMPPPSPLDVLPVTSTSFNTTVSAVCSVVTEATAPTRRMSVNSARRSRAQAKRTTQRRAAM